MTQFPGTAGRSRDGELVSRLAFVGLEENTISQIRALEGLLMQHLPIALDKFYEKIRATPEVSRFFSDETQIARARSAQIRHWQAISSGGIDDTYVANVRRIGQMHAKIGLEPRWYIGGYTLVLEQLFAAIVDEFRPKSLINFNQQTAYQDLIAKLVALTKAVMLDMDFSISTYIEAAESARLKAEAEQQKAQSDAEARQKAADAERQRVEQLSAAERERVLEALTAGLSELAKQNLSHRIGNGLPPQFERVRTDFNSASGQLDEALQVVLERTSGITAATEQILAASENLSRRAQTTAASLEESAAALEETSTSVRNTASSTDDMQKVITKASSKTADGVKIVDEAISAVSKIEDSSKQIVYIVSVIDDIAFQTNLLALNAGVEAARAGEHGRGFAVVASEVRALAQRSAESAREIKQLISTAQENVGDGVKLVTSTGQVFSEIAKAIKEVNAVMAQIASSTQQQAAAIGEVNTAVATMDRDTQENAAMAEQLTAATNVLASETDELKALVTAFKTSDASQSGAKSAKLRVVG